MERDLSHWMINLMSIFEINENSRERSVEWPMSFRVEPICASYDSDEQVHDAPVYQNMHRFAAYTLV
jgi:hypothetical protein